VAAGTLAGLVAEGAAGLDGFTRTIMPSSPKAAAHKSCTYLRAVTRKDSPGYRQDFWEAA